jgi:Arc/MetJ-type ribon-helix-helix transcriptional regulator
MLKVENKKEYRTMGVHIYDEWLEKIETFVGKGKEFTSFSEYARSLIREDLKRRGLLNEELAAIVG